MKYVDTKIVFQEVPDEITLAINISNCPCNCPNCHSSYLAKDIGKKLNEDTLAELINNNEGITCVAFMGGDSDPAFINWLAYNCKNSFNLKTAWYSGRQELSRDINLENLDFVKLGPYIEEKGGLNSETTNQVFYKVEDNKLIDITHKFKKHGN